jgi:hypothetical protein
MPSFSAFGSKPPASGPPRDFGSVGGAGLFGHSPFNSIFSGSGPGRGPSDRPQSIANMMKHFERVANEESDDSSVEMRADRISHAEILRENEFSRRLIE